MFPSSIVVLMSFLLCCQSVLPQYVFDDSVGLGRQFDGVGGLSGGGATSKLLPGYPEQQRAEILDYLFKPNFGASLHILKVEIGGGSQSGIGSEATHIYHDGDENYKRGYEWWLMTEAKKRNPDIKLYGLPWTWSGWVTNGTDSNSPYTDPKRSADYIVKWIKGAKRYYNLTIDYIGEWNEHDYNKTYIKELRHLLDAEGFQETRIVSADYFLPREDDMDDTMIIDPLFEAAVDAMGIHYSSTQSTKLSILRGKQLWASEDYSTFNDVTGGRCWARILNWNYVNGLMTSTISWNLVAAYYDGMPYRGCGLMTADSPWSGSYVVSPPIWMSAHTTQFTKVGWTYLSHRAGVGMLKGNGSYVSLTSPDKSQLTIIFETMAHNDSECLHETLPKYEVKSQDITFELKGAYKDIKSLYVWYSRLGNDQQGDELIFFKQLDNLEAENDQFKFFIDINEIYTFTTVDGGLKGVYPDPPPPVDFPAPFIDKFDSVADHQEPPYIAPMAGSFEVLPAEGGNKILRQMTILKPVDWCETENFTLSIFGNITWAEYFIETSFSLNVDNSSEGVFVAGRINSGGCYTVNGGGVFFHVYPVNGTYEVYTDAKRSQLLAFGPVSGASMTDWNKLALNIQGDTAMGFLNQKLVFGVKIDSAPKAGFVGFGTSGFGHADFDHVCLTFTDDGLRDKTCNNNNNTSIHLNTRPTADTKLYFKSFDKNSPA